MEQMVLGLFGLSISTSLMILLMLLLIPLTGKKFTAKWRYWLWMLLAIRMLCPFSFSMNVPIVKMELPTELTEPQEIVIEQGSPLPSVTVEIPQENSTQPDIVKPEEEAPQPLEWSVSRLELLAYVWLFGAIGSGLWQFVAYRKYRSDVAVWSKAFTDEKIINLYDELCREMNISKAPVLMKSRKHKSPMLIGLRKPILLLPEMECTERDYRLIFRHELCHYKRKDLWYKLLILTVRCVHWFNPLAYVMLRQAENDLEISCDEEVVRSFSEDDRAIYCETILRILSQGKGIYTPLSTGLNSGKKVLQRRFEAVLSPKTGKGIVFVIMGTLCIVMLSGFIRLEAALLPEASDRVMERYLAIPAQNRLIANQLKEGKMVLPVNQSMEFWEEKAKKFYLTNFELRDDLSYKEVGHFFNTVVSDNQLYDESAWRSFQAYLISDTDIRAVLYSHLPVQAIQQEEEPYYFDPLLAFNEEGEKYYPYNELSEVYTFTAASAGNAYGLKVMETLRAEEKEVEAGVKLFTFELAAYDVDKYYAEPQEKKLLERYRFSVRVAEDSWFIEEATIIK